MLEQTVTNASSGNRSPGWVQSVVTPIRAILRAGQPVPIRKLLVTV